jgi:hypothetical protein
VSSPTRRDVLLGGCVAAALAALPRSADARFLGGIADVDDTGPAPRSQCAHSGCRFHRPADGAGGGVCGLSLDGPVVPDEHAPFG